MRVLTVALAALAVAAAPADARRSIQITKPADDGAVAAYPHARSVAAQVVVRGRAARRSPVVVRARCALGPCRTTAVANRRGRFKAYLHVIRDPETSRMGIRATYADTLEGSDLVGVDLVLPAWASALPSRGDELAMIGDSLAVGTAPGLREALAGWRVTTDARTSRFLADGMDVLARTPLPRAPVVLAFSLGTNDDPTHVEAIDAAVRASVARLRPGACAIWATIVRPKVGGVSYRAVNDRLEALALELAPRMRLVDWAAAVKENRRWLRDDRVHATPEGYAARAGLYADAARECVGSA